jgi:hypothetical protein
MWASSDDRWSPEYISTLASILQSNAATTSAASPFYYIDGVGHIASISNAKHELKDYEGANALTRLLKFAFYYRDDFFYGLHRRANTESLTVPIWWGVNKSVAWNNNYPVQAFLLSRGRYVRANVEPLFFKRNHGELVRHSAVQLGSEWLEVAAIMLRIINVAYENICSVYRGSKSILITSFAFTVFSIRCLADLANFLYRVVKPSITFAIKRWVRNRFQHI